MNIRFLPPGFTTKPETGRTVDTPSATPRRADESSTSPAPEASADRVELSSAGLELNARLDTDRTETHGLGADRTRSIAERIATGFYDRPDTIDRIVSRLIPDLEPPR